MRVYEGFRDEDGNVLVRVDGGEILDPRLDLMNHSPSGFEYGYGGSGPAQLALAILADHLRHRPQDMAVIRRLKDRRGHPVPPRHELDLFEEEEADPFHEADQLAVLGHQHFKGAYVAALPRETSWRIDSEGVSEILTRMANHGIPDRFTREDPL